MLFIVLCICFIASVIGAICGIGGGVIIKPVLDAFGIMDVSTISFLSGCTVLSMSAYSLIKEKISGGYSIDVHIVRALAIGAGFGGVFGKELFTFVASHSIDQNTVGFIQSFCLCIVTIGTLLYALNKKRIRTYKVKKWYWCLVIGLGLGILSSFLGIGGGPINLVVLFFFFSMNTKTAALSSLYIILISQIASLYVTIAKGNVPYGSKWMLCFMVVGGILGGMFGRYINKKIEKEVIDKLFLGIMGIIILLNLYNMFKFL